MIETNKFIQFETKEQEKKTISSFEPIIEPKIEINAPKEKKNDFDLFKFISDYRELIIIFAIYITGIILASVCFDFIGSTSLANIGNKLLYTEENSVTKIFINDMCLYFSAYAATLVFGLCSIGMPLVCFVPLINSFIVSFEINYLYSTYDTKGIGYAILLVIPSATLFSVILFLTISESIYMSKSIFNASFRLEKEKVDVKRYLKKFSIYGILIILISLLDSAITTIIASVVTF